MGDMGEFWADVKPALKQRSQDKRASNRKSSADLLAARGVEFTKNNGGAHLIVTAGDHLVDFWPGTGKWTTRGFRFTVVGRGVQGLIRHLEQEANFPKVSEGGKL